MEKPAMGRKHFWVLPREDMMDNDQQHANGAPTIEFTQAPFSALLDRRAIHLFFAPGAASGLHWGYDDPLGNRRSPRSADTIGSKEKQRNTFILFIAELVYCP
jgi:hypothetical protein